MTGAAHGEHDQQAVRRHPANILRRTLTLSTLACLMFAGCFEPATDADLIEPGTEPPGQLFGADAGTNGTCGTVTPSPRTRLQIVVRTTPFNGRYKPRNVGAIWIETSAGAFVKTLEKWGKTRARYITRWNAASGGNVVDAVTSATLATHVTHDRTWDLTDKLGCPVAAGDYRVMVEHTDYNGAGALLQLPFNNGPTPVSQMPADTAFFHDVVLQLP